MAMDWTEFLLKEIEIVYTATIKLFDKVDEANLDWKPPSGSNWMTVGQLLHHITDACGAGCKAFVTENWALPDGRRYEDLSPQEMIPPAEMLPAIQSVEEARTLLSTDIALARKMVEQAGESDLRNRMIAAPWAPLIRCTLGWQLHQMVQHLDKHKSQLFYYLKLQGVPVDTADLWG
jgi:uncharacterized damage-inducible protein DinB